MTEDCLLTCQVEESFEGHSVSSACPVRGKQRNYNVVTQATALDWPKYFVCVRTRSINRTVAKNF